MPQEETKTTVESRKDAIAAAVKDLPEQPVVETEEEIQEVSEETKEEKKSAEESVDPIEAAEALKLFKALKNPETAPAVIEFIAKNAGYEKKSLETKQEVKEATRTIVDDLKETLGDQFEFLADKIGPGIEKYLERKRKEDLADINAKLEAQEREKLEAQSSRIITKLTSDFFGSDSDLPDDVQKEMSKFMDKVPPTPDLSLSDYLDLAFNSAIGKLGLQKVDKKKQERISKNRSDVASRLTSDRNSRTAEAVPDNSKTMSRKEAIAAAIEAVGKQ